MMLENQYRHEIGANAWFIWRLGNHNLSGPSSLSCHELFSMLLLSNHLPILETTFLFLTSILRLRHKEPSTPEGPHEILEVHHQRVQWKCVKRIAVKSVDANVVKQFVIENYSR